MSDIMISNTYIARSNQHLIAMFLYKFCVGLFKTMIFIKPENQCSHSSIIQSTEDDSSLNLDCECKIQVSGSQL